MALPPGVRRWAPNPGSQALFVTCPFREALYDGTRGPGKTLGLLMDFARDVGVGHGQHWRGYLFRRTYPMLDDVVGKAERFFHEVFPRARFNASNYTWIFEDGERLMFRHFDNPSDYWNYHGHEAPWIGWEELTSWPTLECYDVMKACNRWPADSPSAKRGDATRGCRYRGTTNPYGIGHNAVKARFIDPAPPGVPVTENGMTRVRISGHWSENRIMLEANPDYPVLLAADINPERRKAWLDNDWDIVAGGAFDDVWRQSVHVLEPFDIPLGWWIDRAMDWGSSKPFSIGWWAASDGSEVRLRTGKRRSWPRGTLFRINEWYGWNGKANEGCRRLAGDVAREILKMEREMKIADWVQPGPADNSIFDVVNGNSIGDDFRRAGVTWNRSDKSPGSRVAGVERMRKLLDACLSKADEKGERGPRQFMEAPGIFVFNTCRHFIRTVPVLPRDEKKPDDVDTEAEDHCWDETKYRILSTGGAARQGGRPW